MEIFSEMYHKISGMMHICFILCFVHVCKMICGHIKEFENQNIKHWGRPSMAYI
jgi:hypothetical protein